MRLVPLFAVLALALAVPVFAQAPLADNTAPARYFPLQEGNEWIWVTRTDSVTTVERLWLRSGTGTSAFAEVEQSWVDADGIGSSLGSFLSFEHDAETGALLVALPESAAAAQPRPGTECGLGLPFSGGAPLACPDPAVASVSTQGGADRPFEVGGTAYAGTVKAITFPEGPCCRMYTFVADVGLVRAEREGSAPTVLAYAKIGGVEYGDRTSLQTGETAPRPRVTSIRRAYPNPFTDAFTLVVDHPRTGTLMVDVFDVLGRQVYSAQPVIAVGQTAFRVELPTGAPGVYTARIRSASDTWPARPRRLVRIR